MSGLILSNGKLLPRLGLGTWMSQPGAVHKAVKHALSHGYRHIDCAHIYGNESEIGEALKEAFAEGIVTREEVWVTSKLWNDCHEPDQVEAALTTTLENLQLDYLDLYLMHWPIAHAKGVGRPTIPEDLISLEKLPVATTWKAMEGINKAGKARYIGVSNFSVKKLKSLVSAADIKPAVNQIELHPYLQQSAMLEYCAAENIVLTAYSPLGSPARPDSLKSDDEPILLQDEGVAKIAAAHGCTSAQVLLAWALARNTTVIPKSTNPARIEQNFAAQDVNLTEDDMATIAKLDRHRRYVLGDFWTFAGSPYTLANLWDE